MADVAITKQAAAYRLIDVAIRMATRSDDPLAIHVVASSALNLLREILQQRGPGLAEQAMQYGLYKASMARAKDEVHDLPSDENLNDVLDQISAAIEAGNIRDASDIKVTLPPGEERRLLDPILRTFNYLKHAQRDPLATLEEADIKCHDAILMAVGAYLFLFPGEPMPSDWTPYFDEHSDA